MIIECEKCNTKFNLDENLLKEGGSKVRCSICKHVFISFPPETEIEVEESPEETLAKTETLDETLTLDKTETLDKEETLSKTETLGKEEASKEEDEIPDFEKTLIGIPGIGEDEEIEPISFEDLSLLDSGIMERVEEIEPEIDVHKAMDRAAKVEKKVTAEKRAARKDEPEEEKKPVKPPPVIKKKHVSGLWLTILLIVLLLIGAAGALVVFKPDLIPWSIPFIQKQISKEQTLDMGNKRLSFKDLKGFFVDRKDKGKLFVVSGSVANNYPNPRSFIRIRSNILDSKGKVVKSRIAYAGNPIGDKELQSLSMEDMEKRLMNKTGNNKVNTNILPNSSIPFMVIFNELPEDISEFTVEAISSSLAKEGAA